MKPAQHYLVLFSLIIFVYPRKVKPQDPCAVLQSCLQNCDYQDWFLPNQGVESGVINIEGKVNAISEPQNGRYFASADTKDLENQYNSLYDSICGQYPTGTRNMCTDRIVNGCDAGVMFPWMVYIMPGTGTCTGSLLTHRHILTAAHCFCNRQNAIDAALDCYQRNQGNEKVSYDTSDIFVVLGKVNWTKGRKRKVSRITIHPLKLHDTKPETYDLAILTLEEDIKFFDKTTGPICLPDESTSDLGMDLHTAGWGLTSSISDQDTGAGELCSTNQFGPDVFAKCQNDMCIYDPPSTTEDCAALINAYPNLVDHSVYKIKGTGEQCYPFKSGSGWCHTDKSWGFCMESCEEFAYSRPDVLQYIKLRSYESSEKCYEDTSKIKLNATLEMCVSKNPKKPIVIEFVKTGPNNFKEIGRSGGGEYEFAGYFDTCKGDSGGPLWRNVTKTGREGSVAVLVGTVSRGLGCGQRNKPGIVERVKMMKDWILWEIMGEPEQGMLNNKPD